MFTDIQTGIVIHANLNQTVIHATLRTYDLIVAFLEVIKETPEYIQLSQAIPLYVMEDSDSEYWDSEQANYLLNEELFDVLNSYAPEGYYFGNTEGDGSDFGYWEIKD